MPEFEKLVDITDDLKNYLHTNVELFKLQTIEKTSVIGSGLMSSLIIGLVGSIFLIILSIGAGFYLSTLFSDSYSGFIIIAGFYLLIGIILLIGRKKMLVGPFRDKIIRKLLEKD